MDRLKIACVSNADSGHMNPVVHLAATLAAKGHEVRVITFEFGSKKFAAKVQSAGAAFVGLPCETTEEELLQTAAQLNEVPFFELARRMRPGLEKELKTHRPDVVVADFVTFAAQDIALELGIRLVVNVPGPLRNMHSFMSAPDLEEMTRLGPFLITYTKFSPLHAPALINYKRLGNFSEKLQQNLPRALVLVNSFFGLDEPCLLPPQVVPTGALFKLPPSTGLAATHPDLHAFLQKSTSVVYVTTGSMVRLEEWMVRTLFHALKRVRCSVVWSLKDPLQQYLPDRGDPDFFVSGWCPQVELLAHSKVKAVITHCGWGGALECLMAGRPVCTLPFFGDQPDNASLLIATGAAEALAWPTNKFAMEPTGRESYAKNSISIEKAAEAVSKVLTDGKYLQRARELALVMRGPNLGPDYAALHIEGCARTGVDHLRNKKLEKKMINQQALVVVLGKAVGIIGLVILPLVLGWKWI